MSDAEWGNLITIFIYVTIFRLLYILFIHWIYFIFNTKCLFNLDKDDQAFTKVVRKDKWEGEDEDDVKDNWDDEDEEKEEEISKSAVTQQVATKNQKKKSKFDVRIEEKEDNRPKTAEEILADKLEKQRLQEESDLRLAKEAFGTGTGSDVSFDVSLSSKNDFDAFKKNLVDKLATVEKSPHYVAFLENMFRELCVSLQADDIKRISNNLNALWNEKVKAQKVNWISNFFFISY